MLIVSGSRQHSNVICIIKHVFDLFSKTIKNNHIGVQPTIGTYNVLLVHKFTNPRLVFSNTRTTFAVVAICMHTFESIVCQNRHD